MKAPALTADEIAEVLHKEFPQAFYEGCGLSIERVDYGNIRVRRHFHENTIRPGGTISGPTMMELADFAMYVAVFSAVGRQPLAVTTNLNINFMRKPDPGHRVGEGRLLKLGKTLAVGDFTIWNEGEKDPVAHATVTYSIPPKRQ